jgi:nucleoside-diphosphate-sugar epimerase
MTFERQKLRALVTGASGFVGGHLVRRLLAEGWSVRVLVRQPGRLADDVSAACAVLIGDLADGEALARAVAGVDVVFHCAANVATWDSWPAYERVNVSGVDNLLSAIAQRNPGLRRLVHLSSVDVYGFPVLQADEVSPLTGGGFFYGESKLRGEALVRERCVASGLPFTVLRPANIIGPGSQFIQRIGEELRHGLMLKIDKGAANVGFLYIDNLIDVMIWAALSECAAGQSYNVRDTCDVSWQTFLATFRQGINGKGVVINLPLPLAMKLATAVERIYGFLRLKREPFLHRLLVNIFGRTCGHSAAKIRAHAGLAGQVGFAEAMQQSVAWFLENNAGR